MLSIDALLRHLYQRIKRVFSLIIYIFPPDKGLRQTQHTKNCNKTVQLYNPVYGGTTYQLRITFVGTAQLIHRSTVVYRVFHILLLFFFSIEEDISSCADARTNYFCTICLTAYDADRGKREKKARKKKNFPGAESF
jgi:hypothetical protein